MVQGHSSKPASAAGSKSKGKMSMRVGQKATTSTSRSGKSAKSQRKASSSAAAAAAGDSDDNRDSPSASEAEFDDDDLELEEDADPLSDDDEEPNTDDEIEAAKSAAGAKSKKTAKRKRRATSPTSFGLALEGLLGGAAASSDDGGAGSADEDADEDEDAEANAAKPAKRQKSASTHQPAAILSLAPHLRRSAHSVQLSARASRIAIEERRAREERARVKDVIGGWGPPGVVPALDVAGADGVKKDEDEGEALREWTLEGGSTGYERRLRKVAQRGVVKLFNAIRAAQTTTKEDLNDEDDDGGKHAKAEGRSGGAKKANALGGKEARLADLSKNNFLDLIRKGTGAAGSAKGSVAAK
ncbi:hypothetical protein ACQY0O_004176 [Thecaphora frezii]